MGGGDKPQVRTRYIKVWRASLNTSHAGVMPVMYDEELEGLNQVQGLYEVRRVWEA